MFIREKIAFYVQRTGVEDASLRRTTSLFRQDYESGVLSAVDCDMISTIVAEKSERKTLSEISRAVFYVLLYIGVASASGAQRFQQAGRIPRAGLLAAEIRAVGLISPPAIVGFSLLARNGSSAFLSFRDTKAVADALERHLEQLKNGCIGNGEGAHDS
ncbi:hypothetical protein EIP91_010349 [Steccherinum ochraceum]|uniref:Uncharacterized protein n=1 Tax=Steccherinum ochraceum TaxID=92696 RepID=A0A4R0R615_9APHY|nr:hypothetical protein EIP91_010349 [Steccherinum ochraceum]